MACSRVDQMRSPWPELLAQTRPRPSFPRLLLLPRPLSLGATTWHDCAAMGL